MDAITQKAHFWRRAGFGATLDELNSAAKPNDLLDRWLQTQQAIAPPNLGAIAEGKGRTRQIVDFGEWLIDQTVTAANPLQEKVTNFWRDRLIVAIKKIRFPQLLIDYEKRLRTYGMGDFQELLWQVTTSPAMLRYLDNAQNRAGKINENFSREVMELFTIGRGQYTEQDIQEGARALTGWVVRPNRQAGTAEAIFLARQHDNGVKTYLGRQGKLKTEDLVEILANHPSTARNISHKLWSAFAYDNPEPAIVQRLANVYKTSDRRISAVVEAIFRSPEFYSTRAYRSHLKSPFYFIAGTLRQLQIKADPIKVLGSLRAMGQIPYNAPSVKGWPQDSGWLTAPSLLTRLNLAQQMAQDYGDDSGFVYDAQRFSSNDLITLLLDGKADANLKNVLTDLSARERASAILSSPAYQLA